MTSPDVGASGRSGRCGSLADAGWSRSGGLHQRPWNGDAAQRPDETRAIRVSVRGPADPVSSTKSMHGHTLGAAAPWSGRFAAGHHGRLHSPTIHWETQDPECDLDYVTTGPVPLHRTSFFPIPLPLAATTHRRLQRYRKRGAAWIDGSLSPESDGHSLGVARSLRSGSVAGETAIRRLRRFRP